MGSALSDNAQLGIVLATGGIATALVGISLLCLIIFYILIFALPELRRPLEKPTSRKVAEGEDENAKPQNVLVYYVPGLGQLANGFSTAVSTIQTALASLASLASFDTIRVLFVLGLAALAVAFFEFHDDLIEAYNIAYTCEPGNWARRTVLLLFNYARFIAGAIWPVVNTVAGTYPVLSC